MADMSRFRFDSTVTMGNILTVMTLAIGIIIGWTKMEARMDSLERITADNRSMISAQASIMTQLQDSNTKLTTLMDIYVPEIERLRRSYYGDNRPVRQPQ